MKTKGKKIINTLIGKAVFVGITMLALNEAAMSQNKIYGASSKNIGIAAASQVSANNYGTEYSPMLYYKNERRTYFIGPVIQKQKLNLSGIQFNYDYTIVGADVAGNQPDNSNLELFCFITAAYHFNALLGKHALWAESMADRTYDGPDKKDLHFKSAEVYGGIGLKIKLFKNVKWINCVGLGGSRSFDFPKHLYCEANNMGLILKTGLSFDLKK